jgi:pimeloyl-ACP methyl ester carboxylesterase
MFALLGPLLAGTACRTEDPPQAPTDLPAPPLGASAAATMDEICTHEIRRWNILSEGQAVAKTRGACVGKDEQGWHLFTQVTMDGSDQPHHEFHLWLDEDGHPALAQLRTPTANTDFRWDAGKLVVMRLGEQRTIQGDEATGGPWVTPSHSLFIREVMLRLGVGRASDQLVQMSYAPEHDATVSLSLELQEDDQGVVGVTDSGYLRLDDRDGSIGGLRIISGHTRDQPLYASVPADSEGRTRLEPRLPTQPVPSYVPTQDLAIVAVTVPGNEEAPTLAGELVMPAQPSGKPRPGVLFLSGSGPQERHGFVPGSSIDVGSHEIHDALARAGFVVLRLDDRGVGESELGPNATPGYLEYVSDARRAMQFLADDERVDPSRVLLMGHGEGALTAAKIGSERIKVRGKRHKVAGVVLLAAPGRNLREVIYGEIRAALAHTDEYTQERAVDDARRVHEAALADRELPASSEPLRDWMVEIFKEDPIAAIRSVKSPILALQGGKDFQIDPQLDFGALTKVIESTGAEGSEAKMFEELDHLFKPEPARSIPGHYADLGRRVAPDFLSYLSGWAMARCDL